MNHFLVFKQEKQYHRLFWAGLINGIGDRFSQVAVLGLLLSLTGSGLAVGITFAIRLVPYLLFGPLGGMLADRLSKKSIMIATDLIRIVFALAPLLVVDSSDIWIIYASSFLLSAGEALYAPARMSSIPQMVQKKSLLSVNGLEEAMLGIVLIGGSLTGGIIAATIGVEAIFVLNALSFLFSALLLSKLTMENKKAPESPEQVPGGSRANGMNEFRQLLSGSAFVRIMLIVFALWPIGDGIFNILLSVYAVQVFHMGDIGIGTLYGALGLGLVAGSSFTGKFANKMKVAAVLALLLEGIVNMLISQSTHFALVVLLLIITAGCSAIGNACNRTILMNVVPEHFQGRFFATLATVQNTIMGATMFLAGLGLEKMAPRTLGFAGGLLFVTAGGVLALIFFTYLHKKDREHHPTPGQEEVY